MRGSHKPVGSVPAYRRAFLLRKKLQSLRFMAAPLHAEPTGLCPVPDREPERSEWFMGVVQGYTASPMSFWYVYVLRSARDRQFYIGSTNDLDRRVLEHQKGKNISTAKRLPIELVYFEGHRSKEDAVRREHYFKTTKGKVTLRQMLRESLR